MEPASPSVCVSASLSLSVTIIKNKNKKKKDVHHVSILLSHSASFSPLNPKDLHLFWNEKTHDHTTYLFLNLLFMAKILCPGPVSP